MNNELTSRPLDESDLGQNLPKSSTSGQKSPEKPVRSTTSPQQKIDSNSRRSAQAQSAQPTQNKQAPVGQKPATNSSRPSNQKAKPSNFDRPRRARQTTFSNGNFNQGSSNPANAKPATKLAGVSKIDAGKLKIIPLGGLGEVGKNIMALEYENDIIVMDMGFTFPGEDLPGVDLVVPDATYLEQRKHKVRGIVITHAHEDHVGGIPFILPKIPAPIYGAKFTAKFIERKLEEYRMGFVPQIHTVDPDKCEKVQLGVFTVEFVRITHSIPDACLLVVHTPLGKIVNTGDWRFEPEPIDGRPTNMARLAQLGNEDVLMLMCDSTNCEVPGRSPSEHKIVDTLDDIFIRNYNKRVIVASFSSQINRIQLTINAAAKAKRKLAVVGRSMLSNLELGIKLGYVKVPPGLIIRSKDINRYQDSEVVVLCTGSQGEEFSALTRMGTGEHREIKIKPSDVVVLSASIIPGNEKSVWGMVDNLFRWGAYVYQSYTSGIDELGVTHATGHAYVDEIKEMIDLVKPRYYLPIHGEFHHLVHNAMIGKAVGIPEENVFIIENGDTLVADQTGVKKGSKVQTGAVLVDGNGVGDVQAVVIKDRLSMGNDGVFMAIATVERKTGKLKSSPDIISRGFIYMKDNEELIQKSRQIVKKIIDGKDPAMPASALAIKTRLREELSNYLYKVTKRNPIILPVVIEI